MAESFGARLRVRREGQGIALCTIADELKIKLSLLEAVERDDVSHWPSGIYRRAFIRAYAQAIGLNPDVIVREFLDLYPDPDEVIAAAAAIASEPRNGRSSGGPPTRLRNIVQSAFGSVSRLRRGGRDHDPVVPARVSARTSEALESSMMEPPRFGPVSFEPAAFEAEPFEPAPQEVEAFEGALPQPVAAELLEPELLESEPSPSEPFAPDGYESAGSEPIMFESAPQERVSPVASELSVAHASDEPAGVPDLLDVARLCTEFGRVRNVHELQPLLQESARILDAIGLIVWLWDGSVEQLRPALVHGYSEKVLAQLPDVSRDADNATAAAFRSAQPCTLNGRAHHSGALVVPLVEWDGCAGVLAIELQDGREQVTSVQAVATIIAAALTQLITGSRLVDASREADMPEPEMIQEQVAAVTRPLRVRR